MWWHQACDNTDHKTTSIKYGQLYLDIKYLEPFASLEAEGVYDSYTTTAGTRDIYRADQMHEMYVHEQVLRVWCISAKDRNQKGLGQCCWMCMYRATGFEPAQGLTLDWVASPSSSEKPARSKFSGRTV